MRKFPTIFINERLKKTYQNAVNSTIRWYSYKAFTQFKKTMNINAKKYTN